VGYCGIGIGEGMTVSISLFGTPTVQRHGADIHLDTRKATALAAYLAMTDGAQPRDTVAALLWPDSDTGTARGSLRRMVALANPLGRQNP
jgi:DNA-binding SARP family transcriptional activator